VTGNKKISFFIAIVSFVFILTNADANSSFKENADQKTLEILDIFEAVSAIPRCSYNEDEIRNWLKDRAYKNGLIYRIDLTGNILIKVPATKGYENAPKIVLQSHLDMVCEKRRRSYHDFSKDPIKLVYDDKWLQAESTTLGADNGIGIALLIALAEDKKIAHPALELLFTVQEEAGLIGASQLDPDFFKGRRYISLDSEEQEVFTIGSAGGQGYRVRLKGAFEEIPKTREVYTIAVSGLAGGHSGGDIHINRGNANKILGSVLESISKNTRFHLVSLKGGRRTSAIPDAATARICFDPLSLESVKKGVLAYNQKLNMQLALVNDSVSIRLGVAENRPANNLCISYEDTMKMVQLISHFPNGVEKMSSTFADSVETSSNLGTLELKIDTLTIRVLARSASKKGLKHIRGKIKTFVKAAGADFKTIFSFPAWEPQLDSGMLAQSKKVYKKLFQKDPVVSITHGGLEGSWIAKKKPDIDMIAIGPTIENAHSPNERLDLQSVKPTWDFIVALLASSNEIDKKSRDAVNFPGYLEAFSGWLLFLIIPVVILVIILVERKMKRTLNPDLGAYLWLAAGMALFVFSTGTRSMAAAQWIFPIFLLRFMHFKTLSRGSVILMLAVSAGFYFSWHHIATPGAFRYNLIIMAVANGIWMGLIFLVDRRVSNRFSGILSCLVFPLVWTSMNFILSIGTEVKWGYLGDIQPLFMLQIASVTGIWGLVFLMTFFASVVHYAWLRAFKWARVKHVIYFYVFIFCLVVLMGTARLAFFAPLSETVRVAGITGPETQSQMIDLGLRKELPPFEKTIDVMETLSRKAARGGAKIVFWQEYGAIMEKENASQFIKSACKLAREEKIHLILGMCAINLKAGRDSVNKVVYIDNSGNVVGEFRKHRFALKAEAYHMKQGKGVIKPYQTPVGKIASVFSLDTDHPHFIRRAGKADLDILLVHASNFLGNAKIPTQRTKFLAIENGFSMIRCTGAGVSAAFDHQGRTLSVVNHIESENPILFSDVPVNGVTTIYSRIGDLFPWICFLGSIVLVVLGFFRPVVKEF